MRHAPALRTDTNLGAWLFTVARNLYWSHRRVSALEDDVEPATLALWPMAAPGPTPFDLAAGGASSKPGSSRPCVRAACAAS